MIRPIIPVSRTIRSHSAASMPRSSASLYTHTPKTIATTHHRSMIMNGSASAKGNQNCKIFFSSYYLVFLPLFRVLNVYSHVFKILAAITALRPLLNSSWEYLSFKSAVSHQSLRGASLPDARVKSTRRWLVLARFLRKEKRRDFVYNRGVFWFFSGIYFTFIWILVSAFLWRLLAPLQGFHALPPRIS